MLMWLSNDSPQNAMSHSRGDLCMSVAGRYPDRVGTDRGVELVNRSERLTNGRERGQIVILTHAVISH